MARKQMVSRRATAASLGITEIIRVVIFGIKSLLVAGVILGVLFFSVNLMLKYAASLMKASSVKAVVKAQSSASQARIKPASAVNSAGREKKSEGFVFNNPLSTPMYTVIGNEELIIFSDGSCKKPQPQTEALNLPVLTGNLTGETSKKSPAFGQLLKLDKRYLADISEVNISNPKEIVMITISNKTLRCGDSVTNDKLANYKMAAREYKKLRKPYSCVDLRLTDRVIIK